MNAIETAALGNLAEMQETTCLKPEGSHVAGYGAKTSRKPAGNCRLSNDK